MTQKGCVLITGGASGIGLGIVRHLAGKGYTVAIFDRNAPPEGTPARFTQVDLADESATAKALADLTGAMSVTNLVNNVAAVHPARLEDVTRQHVREVFEVNIGCTVQCTQALLPAMKAAGYGRIVNISSRAGLGKSLRTVYGASKAGVHSLTRTWTLELSRYGITVNDVAPGPIETPLFREANTADNPRTRYLIDSIPVGRMGQPEDIANAVAFFLDPASSFVTGQVLYVCGGMSIALAGADGHPPVPVTKSHA